MVCAPRASRLGGSLELLRLRPAVDRGDERAAPLRAARVRRHERGARGQARVGRRRDAAPAGYRDPNAVNLAVAPGAPGAAAAGPRPGPKLLRSSKFRSKQASITQNKQVSLKTNNYH